MEPIAFGRLLRSNTTSCVVGCSVSQTGAPAFGQMVRIPLEDGVTIYGWFTTFTSMTTVWSGRS